MSGRKLTVDIPHLIFATALAGWATWFCWDAWRSSPDVENLIMIVPVAAIAAALYIFIAITCLRGTAKSIEPPLAPGVPLKIAGSMALLIGLVIAGPYVGFDVASFLYILAMMAFLGERRILFLILVPLLFCVVVIYCFNSLLATPLPLFFFGDRAA